MSSLIVQTSRYVKSQQVISRSFSCGSALFAKKPKADVIVVGSKSVVSGHFRPMRRARLGDKVEFLAFDPWVQKEVIYRETEKIKLEIIVPNYCKNDFHEGFCNLDQT